MKGRAAKGRLVDDDVIVDDEKDAQRLHQKGVVGTPLSGGGLRLSRIEAAHAAHEGRLKLATSWNVLVHGHEATYLAYADLRDRGLVVRHEGDGFMVWPRGEQPPTAPWFPFYAANERDAVDAAKLRTWADASAVVGVVDDDGAVTHYRFDHVAPTGTTTWPEGHAAGTVMADRVIVHGGLPGDHALGTPHGNDLVLSLTEAEALRRRGVLDVDGLEGGHQHHFRRTLPVYETLRDAGIVTKSGFRFGTHFRGYNAHPDKTHAQWLIQCVADEDVLHWSELSRAVRLAHGVRKTFLVATVPEVSFLGITWFRP